VIKPVVRTNLLQHDSHDDSNKNVECGEDSGKIIAQVIHKFNSIYVNDNKEYGMVQTYNLSWDFFVTERKEKMQLSMK
jgi:hypothetical protein